MYELLFCVFLLFVDLTRRKPPRCLWVKAELFWRLSPQRRSGLEDHSPAEEVTDTEDNEEEDLGVLDDQRSIILHLLSQLKLGMDLTRVRPPNPAPFVTIQLVPTPCTAFLS